MFKVYRNRWKKEEPATANVIALVSHEMVLEIKWRIRWFASRWRWIKLLIFFIRHLRPLLIYDNENSIGKVHSTRLRVLARYISISYSLWSCFSWSIHIEKFKSRTESIGRWGGQVMEFLSWKKKQKQQQNDENPITDIIFCT